MLKKDKSEALTKEFNEIFPGGHSNYRIPLEVTKHRLFVDRAEGSHLWDVDGNEYIEYNGAMGPVVLGHRNPEYVAAIKEFLDTTGTVLGSNLVFTPQDVEVGKMIREFVPCVDELKFNITGSEAVQLAIRIARAYTGKTVVVRFAGHYHGWFDNVLGGHMNPDPNARPNAYQGPEFDKKTDLCYTDGKSPWAANETFIIEWNNFEQLEKTFDKYHDEIAMIHFEGVVCNHDALYPKPGFLEKIRELCDKYNVVMSMDEVITGFRLGLGGAQEYLGVTPDICTFGKAISAGIPLSAVGGKKKIMEILRDRTVLGPGTYPGYGLGMASSAATLKILSKNNAEMYDKRQKVQDYLIDGLVKVAEKNNVPLTITEAPGVFFTLFGIPGGRRRLYTEDEVKDYNAMLGLKFQAMMQQEGIFLMMGSRWYLSAAHTIEDADKTIAAADKCMANLLK